MHSALCETSKDNCFIRLIALFKLNWLRCRKKKSMRYNMVYIYSNNFHTYLECHYQCSLPLSAMKLVGDHTLHSYQLTHTLGCYHIVCDCDSINWVMFLFFFLLSFRVLIADSECVPERRILITSYHNCSTDFWIEFLLSLLSLLRYPATQIQSRSTLWNGWQYSMRLITTYNSTVNIKFWSWTKGHAHDNNRIID